MAQEEKALGYLPMGALLGILINAQSGINRINFMEVATTSDLYYANNAVIDSPEELLRELIDINDAGEFALRYGSHTASGATKLPIKEGELDTMQHLRSVIGKDAEGRPYLRINFQTVA